MITKKYLNESECSLLTGIAKSTLRNMRWKRSGLKYYKISKSVRYSMSDILEFMNRNLIEVDQ